MAPKPEKGAAGALWPKGAAALLLAPKLKPVKEELLGPKVPNPATGPPKRGAALLDCPKPKPALAEEDGAPKVPKPGAGAAGAAGGVGHPCAFWISLSWAQRDCWFCILAWYSSQWICSMEKFLKGSIRVMLWKCTVVGGLPSGAVTFSNRWYLCAGVPKAAGAAEVEPNPKPPMPALEDCPNPDG